MTLLQGILNKRIAYLKPDDGTVLYLNDFFFVYVLLKQECVWKI